MTATMNRSGIAFLVLLSLLLAAVPSHCAAVEGAQHTAEACEALGFQREVVRCNDCDTLLLHTGSDTMWKECRSCCTGTADGSADVEVKYTSAKIVCSYLTETLQNKNSVIAQFVERYADRPYFKKISLEDRRVYYPGPPELLLITESGEEHRIIISFMAAHKIDELLTKKLSA